MVFRCNKSVKVFSTRSELHQHHEMDHGRVKLAEMQGGKFPCPRCSREFLSESMLVNHSRDHIENIYGCNECPWHFNTVAGLIKHCKVGGLLGPREVRASGTAETEHAVGKPSV